MSENLDSEQNTARKDEGDQPKVTILTIIGSILASWFGVQSNKNRERDFTHGKASTFIFAGIIFVFLFILFVIGIVQLVMHFAAPS
jgi:hypothetical protein